MANREWKIDGIVYKYRVKGGTRGKPFTYGSPDSICTALRPQWLTMPAMAERYQNRMATLAQEGARNNVKKRPIQDPGADHPTSISTTNSIHWFQRHLAPTYQMKFVGPLGRDVVARFAEELSQHCDEALHQNLDGIAQSPLLNPFLAAVEQDATSLLNPIMAVSCEADMQTCVAAIIRRQQIILETILANRSRRLSLEEPNTVPLVFDVTEISNAQDATNHDGTSLRTMAWPNSTPCTHIAVSLANSEALFDTEDESYIALNPALRDRVFKDLWNYELKRWIVPKELKNDQLLSYQWPSCSHSRCLAQDSGTAQPDAIQLAAPGHEFQAVTAPNRSGNTCDYSIYHEYDISGDSFSDQDMLDKRPDVAKEFLTILGLGNSPVLEPPTNAGMDVHPSSDELNQVSPNLHELDTLIDVIAGMD
jgi:hypothetical protein